MISPIIAAAGKDVQRVRQSGLRCLHLCSVLDENGSFTVLQHPACVKNDLLGIADDGGIPRSPVIFADSAVNLAVSRRCGGILADFQRKELAEVTAELDSRCSRAGLSLWIPIELIGCAPHAVCTAGTAISGGRLSERFSELIEQFGCERIAAQL